MPLPVGSCSSSASPYGILDMGSNVLEWTSTTFQPYPYQDTDGREDLSHQMDRVLRGGQQDFLLRYRRAARRCLEHDLWGSDYYIGVRLACGKVVE